MSDDGSSTQKTRSKNSSSSSQVHHLHHQHWYYTISSSPSLSRCIPWLLLSPADCFQFTFNKKMFSIHVSPWRIHGAHQIVKVRTSQKVTSKRNRKLQKPPTIIPLPPSLLPLLSPSLIYMFPPVDDDDLLSTEIHMGLGSISWRFGCWRRI